MDIPDAILVKREFVWSAKILHHATSRGSWIFEKLQGREKNEMRKKLLVEAEALIKEFEAIWLARNRPGGFSESVERMRKMKFAYVEK